MMPLYHIRRKCTENYKSTEHKEKFSHIIYTDDIKLSAKNEKQLVTNTNNKNILSIYRNGVWHRKTCPAYNEEW